MAVNDKRPLTIRAEGKTFEKLKFIAAKNKRSLNSEIEISLERAVEAYEAKHGPIPLPEDNE